MKKNIFIILITFLSASIYSQNSYDINQRKGKLFFSLGTELRPLLIREKGANSNPLFDTASNIDFQSSGMAFSYSLEYFINKNLSLGFSQSIRYDLITLPIDEITANFGYRPANNDFIFFFI